VKLDSDKSRSGRARLLIVCPDRPGVVAAVSTFLYERGANIVESAQHSTDPVDGTFFMRMEFVLDGIESNNSEFEAAFQRSVADRFSMEWRASYVKRRKRIGILVSRYDHCLVDLLWRWRRSELEADIVGVVSNHVDLESAVATFGVPFMHVPVRSGSKAEAENEILRRFEGRVDFLVLARYMQILSRDFLTALAVPVINIHHGFLPAFAGARPYARAAERGVKIIGATAHYVTEDLDAGPIIEQDVGRVTHADDAAEFERIGRDIERVVLARAVQWQVDDRVLVHDNRTLVFA
jgi:formyltetrahydrofolate deformylase